MRRVAIATLILGVLLNLLGWAGNVFLLGDLWDRAGAVAPPPLAPPFPGLAHELLTFVSDFVFAFVWTCVYALARPGWQGAAITLAFVTGVLTWLGGVPMTYLGIVNSGYLPADVAIATSVLAFATFLLCAPLMPRLIPPQNA